MSDGDNDPHGEDEELVLSDLLSRVLDKGVVIKGDIVISVADVDLVRLGLQLALASVETESARAADRQSKQRADVPVLPPGDPA